MILKSLELAGFKSFARSTRLEFPTGLTALVGPNGSGKSNLVDAVRWCLGEQSMRDLRGQRSEDVIYAGQRRVLGAAEVGLTFDTGGRDLQPAEISVARRLLRSGESEYLVNRRKARLRDLSMTMRDLGIDNARHVVVSQGMADAWLAATPGERRGLLEAAAGLAGYRERRNEARDKLATSARNMETIEAVLAELEPRVKLLRRQARAVQERDSAQEALRSRLVDWYAERWNRLSAQIMTAKGKVIKLGEERRSRLEALQQLEAESESALQQEREWHQRAEAAAAALHMIERERDALAHQLSQAQSRRAEAERAAAEAQGRRARLARTLGERVQRAEVAAREREQLGSSLEELRRRRLSLEVEVSRLDEDRRARRRKAEETRVALRGLEETLARETRDHARLSRSVEDRKERRKALDRWIGECDDELGPLRQREMDLARGLDLAERQVADLRRALDLLDERGKRLEQRGERLNGIRRNLTSRQARLESALSAARLTEAELGDRVTDTLVARLRIAAGWERALSVALGEWAHVVVDLPAAAGDLMGATDDYLAWRDDLPVPSAARWADQVVAGPCLGPLPGTLFVESPEDGARLWRRLSALQAHRVGSPPLQVVDRTGRCWSGAGSREGGPKKTAEVYLRAKHQAADAQRGLDLCRQRLERLAQAAASDQAKLATLTSEGAGIREKLSLTVHERDRGRTEREAVCRRLEHLDQERSARAGQLTTIDGELEREMEALSLLEQAHRKTSSLHSDAVREAESADEAAREAASQAQAMRQELSLVEGELAGLEAGVRRHAELAHAALQDAQHLTEEIDSLDVAVSQGTEHVAFASAEIEAVTAQRSQLDQALREQTQRVEDLQRGRPQSAGRGQEITQLRDALSTVIGAHERRLAELDHLEGQRAVLGLELTRDLTIDHEGLCPSGEPPPSDDEIKRLRNRAAQGADLDLSVVDEWRELDERQRYLEVHLQDLKGAAEALQQTIQITDREMRGRFETAFKAVSEEFASVFQVMLRGGRAWLEQQEDGGIEIHAELPGRRSRASAAFSGGERSLVASSLLFGLLRIRPAPFCILDEVDAALDENNVDRYLSVLREVSTRTQTIVVTHNRATMAAADILYGVTMDDEGVSRVLSLRLDAFDAAV